MRICFVTNLMQVGGIETNLVLLAREMSARGHQVSVVSAGGELVGRLEEVGARHRSLSDRTGWKRVAADVGILRDHLSAEQPDVVHTFSAYASLVAAAASKRIRSNTKPVRIASIMGLESSPDESKYKVLLRCYATALGVDKLIVIAPSIGEVVRKLPIASDRVVRMAVVGVDTKERRDPSSREISELTAALGKKEGAPLVTTIGALAPRKSHHLFVEAAVLVKDKHPEARFAIVGDGALREELQRRVDASGVSDEVRLVGERSDVPEILALTDVYVRPGIVEGFVGITVLEAQAHAVPVVSFETEDVKLAITPEVTGLLAHNGDSHSLSRAILRLIEDPAFARRIAAAGRASVVEHWAIDKVAAGLDEFYRSVIADRSA